MDGSGLVTEVLVNHTPYETRVAILEGGVLQDFFVERERKRGIVGNIYKGKVQRVLPGMDAAFIDIGLERAGFLHVKNVVRRGDKPPERISDVLREGQSLLVQVLKDPIGSKGARLTMEISIPSRFLVFLPTADEIGVSIKIASEEQRQTLREAVAGFHQGRQGGFIVRTAIESADVWAMRADMQYLQRVWEAIVQQQRGARPGSLIYGELPLYQKVLRDFVSPGVRRVVVDHPGAHREMQAFAANFLVGMEQTRLEFYSGDRSLFERYGIEEEISLALKRHVALKSGGYLIIDQTEAMTTIDVNTGAFVGKLSQDDTIYRPPTAPAQPRRHHHARFHRHERPRTPAGRDGRAPRRTRGRPQQIHHQPDLAARHHRDDAQTHARKPAPTDVRTLPVLPGAWLRQNRGNHHL